MHIEEDNTVKLLYKTEYPWQSDCEQAPSNCKLGYYGSGTSDPFVSKPPCVLRDSKYRQTCEFKKHKLSTPSGIQRFEQDFKDSPSISEYASMLTPICDSNPANTACDVSMDIYYKTSTPWYLPSTFTDCRDWQNARCLESSYGNLWKNSYTDCDSPQYGVFYPMCNMKSGTANSTIATAIGTDFVDTKHPERIRFLLGPFCKSQNFQHPSCKFDYTLYYDVPYDSERLCSEYTNGIESRICAAGVYGSGTNDPFVSSEACIQRPDGKWYKPCVLKSGTINSASGKDKLLLNFKKRPQYENENALREVLNSYCQNNTCNFDQTTNCIEQPWLIECGGNGDKCKYNPTLPECKVPPCTDCGGEEDQSNIAIWVILIISLAGGLAYYIYSTSSTDEYEEE